MRLCVAFLVGVLIGGSVVPAVASQPAPRRLSFADAAAAALRANLTLRAAAFDVAVAEVQLAQARAAKNPQISLSASYTRTQEQPGQTLTFPNPFGPTPPVITVTLAPPDPNLLALRLAAQYPLYSGGRAEAQIALAEANLRGARAVLERTRQQVVFSVQQAYLQALLAQESLTAARHAAEQADENLRVAQARLRAGVAPAFDVLQAEVAVANAQQAVARATSQVRSTHVSLNALVGLPLDAPLHLTDSLEPRPVAGTMADAIARGLRERPELAEVRARMDAAQASIELAASGGRPSVVLGVNYDVTGGGSLSGLWSVTIAVTLSLYDGGITRERIREAELRLEQLKVVEAHIRQRIELEVRQAWFALEQSAAELVAAQKAADQAQEASRIARVRFDAGVGTSLELTSAQAAAAQAELGLAQARFGQNLARIQLLLAVGGTL
ncbi:MAG: TolC family protein [Armatimonadota bacterium]|nr:TolC family protein [Armatimonadota bacterium]MDR5696929.1 TolC family protein [Armatimonadota bacterium]